ncbi:unnamed protein product, partial [Polarella glacialis]
IVASTGAAAAAVEAFSKLGTRPAPRVVPGGGERAFQRRGRATRVVVQAEEKPSTLVTDWNNAKKAAELEVNYCSKEVVVQRAEIAAFLRLRPGERVLDVGCGPGFLME